MKKFLMISMLVFSIFMVGCSQEKIIEYKNLYEEEAFKGITNEEEKIKIINTEFMKTLFSIDKTSKNNETELKMIELYSTDDFFNIFKEKPFRTMKAFDRRNFTSCEVISSEKGSILYKDKEVAAYVLETSVSYKQNYNDMIKKLKIIYIIDENGDIKITDLLDENLLTGDEIKK